MKCDKVDLGPGTFAFVCTRGRRHNCQFCSRYATKQCDFPIVKNGKETTCSAWCCDRCAVSKGPNVDWCPPHERNATKIMEARLAASSTVEIAQDEIEAYIDSRESRYSDAKGFDDVPDLFEGIDEEG